MLTIRASRLQTRMQIINPVGTSAYNGMIQSTMRIASGEGVLKLWRGMSSVVVGAGMMPTPKHRLHPGRHVLILL